jgi:hypothetical protein
LKKNQQLYLLFLHFSHSCAPLADKIELHKLKNIVTQLSSHFFLAFVCSALFSISYNGGYITSYYTSLEWKFFSKKQAGYGWSGHICAEKACIGSFIHTPMCIVSFDFTFGITLNGSLFAYGNQFMFVQFASCSDKIWPTKN